MSEKMGFPVVMSAPSGGGKNTVAEKVLAKLRFLTRSRSVTTRKIRAGEAPGHDYEYVTRERFEEMRAKGEFAEWAKVHGHLYGTPKAYLERACSEGKCPLLVIDVQGGLAMKALNPRTVLIFLMPPSLEEAERRLRGRGTETEEEIAGRMQNAAGEIRQAANYDYILLNETVDLAAEQVCTVIGHERSLQK